MRPYLTGEELHRALRMRRAGRWAERVERARILAAWLTAIALALLLVAVNR